MARRIVSAATIATVTPVADTIAFTSGQYLFAMNGGSATQTNYIHEISISGQAASSSSPTYWVLGRDSTVCVTLGATTTTDAPLDPNTAALGAPVVTGNTWTTNGQRAATLHLLNASLNAFGGVYFWRANKIEEAIRTYGQAVNLGEVSLTAYTGGTPGACGGHMIYESI